MVRWLAVWTVLISECCFAQSAASVLFITGAVQIVGKDGASRAAERGMELSVGETVVTGDGRVQLRFRDGAHMALQPSTQFRVDDFRFGGDQGGEERGFFSLLKGGFRTLTGLIGKVRKDQYRVDAVVATIGIRGTDYAAHLGSEGLAATTHAGLIEVCNDAGCMLVAPGETAWVAERNAAPRRGEQRSGGGAASLSGDWGQRPMEAPAPPASPVPSAPVSTPAAVSPPSIAGPNLR